MEKICKDCKTDKFVFTVTNNKLLGRYVQCKQCSLNDKTRNCPKCNSKILHLSRKAKEQATNNGTLCKKCKPVIPTPLTITSEQEEFLIGLMLGDGCICYANKRHSLYPRLTLRRQSQDKDYCDWQYEILKEYYNSPPKFLSIFDKRTKKYYDRYSLQSKSCWIFKKYYEKWYSNKRKKVPRNLKLTPLILLIWFLDDGCVIKSSKNGLTLQLSTQGFIKSDVDFLADLLSKYLKSQYKVYGNSKNGFLIRSSTLPTIKFIETIDDIFPSFMERKRKWKDFNFEYAKTSKFFG